ncbi:MAG: hypothetical protein A2Y76_03380 [Planctomycetes bacterium RBG_13_60_9]|nr:MAG: hypothetical protein A2Y76_03380 [Planctomycetes bacterium RBG_13_60_9]
MSISASSHGVRHRRTLSRLLKDVLLVVVCLSIPAVAATYGGGNGTADAPFLIRTAEDFKMIGENPADWHKQFKLVNDIDLSGYSESNLQLIGRWVALGSTANQPFSGIFDGNGKTISNFSYKDLQRDFVGLFAHVVGEIRDLKLVRARVIADKLGAGALVGCLERGDILDCSATKVDISGKDYVGGLVGSADGNIHRSCSDGRVEGVLFVGGLVGHVGKGTIAHSYSKAQVTGNESVGGLVGATTNEMSIVNSCYALGDVDGGAYVGGLVGQVAAGRVFRCYSAGQVSGNQFVGGLVGYQRALAEVTASLWDLETSQQTKSVGGTGQTTVQMKSMDTFLAMNWDFYGTWTICEGMNYPVLQWQIPLGDLCCPDGVNFLDFVWFAANWRHNNCRTINLNCEGADLDKSGSVEFRDLSVLAENWLAGVE